MIKIKTIGQLLDYVETEEKALELIKYINQLQSNWNSLKECIYNHIDSAREELNMIMQGDDLDYINQCSKEFEVIRKNLEMILDKMNELEGVDNENN